TSSAEVLRRVGAPDGGLTLERDGHWRSDGERVLPQAQALFPRKDLKPVNDNPMSPAAPGTPPPPAQPQTAASPPDGLSSRISFDDFMKVDLRVAKVISAERVPKSQKLLKLLVDV